MLKCKVFKASGSVNQWVYRLYLLISLMGEYQQIPADSSYDVFVRKKGFNVCTSTVLWSCPIFPQKSSPGEKVFQRSGLVFLLTDHSISLLLLHLSHSGGEGVDVVKYSLHGNGNLKGLLTNKIDKNQSYSPKGRV